MASKASKKEKKDEAPATAVASMASLVKLLEEHRDALSKEFKSAMTSLEAKLDFVQETVTDHGNRLTSLEANANQLSDKMEELEAKCAAMEGSYNKLKAKAIDLESRSRRNNIRITGLPESIEGARPTDFFSRLLVELLGDQVLTTAPELDRAHRALTAKQGPGSRSRAVIARIHHFRTKELIVQEARKRRGKLFFQGKPVAIFEDYCPEIVEQRAAYREVMSALYQRGLRPSLLYPARLRITTKDGGKKHFASVEDATSFLKTLQALLGSPLSQFSSKSIANPVVRHTLKVWVQFRRSFGHKDFSLLSPVASNHFFVPSRHDSTFQGWHGKGISQFKDMFTNGNFMSFDQLSEKYNLPKTHFFRYLQARHYVRSVLPCFPKEPDSNPVDMFLSFNPMSPKAMSTLYRNISTLIQAPLAVCDEYSIKNKIDYIISDNMRKAFTVCFPTEQEDEDAAKQVKKDSMPTEDVATSNVSMAALTSLLESHKVSLSAEFKTVIAALESKMYLIHATISDHGQRITSLESNADLVDGRLRLKARDQPPSSPTYYPSFWGPNPAYFLLLMITTENGDKVRLSSVEEAKKRLILLKWIHSSPPTHNRWIHEILYCVRLERIKFSLRGSLTTFHNTWQPFLDHIDTLTIDEEPNT
ncbi:hypothetical protein F7725_017526 [Dissostichus mawsoni]|uniref:Transposase n=1 Tax=Dissostichus mawsoni TaxID=36200 RepID=A0A7J5Z5I8_DISMA|nr:hypothetical protein F7725_017526 [Dissostichus mawsoni]